MIYEHAELHINPTTADQFLTDFTAVRHLLLAAKGCHSVELLPSIDSPDTYLLRVGWKRIEDHTETFPETYQAKEVTRVLTAHCIAPPRVIHFEGQDASAMH
jgi:heme-degrading monooxygenase HmoA